MSTTPGNHYVYVTYIRTSQQELWDALTSPAFMEQYWFGMTIQSDFRKGSSWRLTFPDGRLADSGEILESDPPRRLVIKWRNEWKPELTAEGWSRCVMELEAVDAAIKLTITHGMEVGGQKFVEAVGSGWPRILSNLKSLLETGSVLSSVKHTLEQAQQRNYEVRSDK